MSGLDKGDLIRQFGNDDAASQLPHSNFHHRSLGSVRVATIDNFQGEQADIIIVSLVRSNKGGDIGFLKSRERVNVMLSRARHGQIILGNLDTFTNARNANGQALWRSIRSLLESRKQISRFFPTKCAVHAEVTHIASPGDFAKHCPSGGCHLVCGHEYACGHVCMRLCHPRRDHVEWKCEELCDDKCPRGHTVVKHRGQRTPLCQETISWNCPLNHQSSGPCHKGARRSGCKGCKKMASAQLLTELAQKQKE